MNYEHFQIKGLKARAVLKLWLSFHYEKAGNIQEGLNL